MRLPKEQRAVVNAAIDECMGMCEGDVTRAAYHLADELHDMEGSGSPWVAELVEACTNVGVRQLIRSHMRSRRVGVQSTTMPAYYTVGLSSAQWMHVDVDELEPIIERLTKMARSYTEHAAVLMDAQQYAADHGVSTAAEAFAAEGIPVELAS